MKKLLPALAAVAALGASGAALYHFRPPGGANSAEGTAARWLPAGTALLLSLPDPARTAAGWKTTDLYQIGQEPAVQAFLSKPLSKAAVPKELTVWLEQAARLQPHGLFIALTALDEKNNQPHVVAGFEFTGTPAAVDQLLAAPKDQLRRRFPAGRADLINYQGHPVETFDAGEGSFLASVCLGNRYLVANDLALLKATVDWIEGRAAANAPALDRDADFQTALARMPAHYDTLIFARPRVFMNRLYTLLAASGQAVSDEQRAEAGKVRAIAATTQIDHGKLRDTLYTLAPGHRSPPAILKGGPLGLTTADTLLYAAGIVNVPPKLELPPGVGVAALAGLAETLQSRGLSLADFHAAFGHELALQLDWPASSGQPTLLASLDVRDPGTASRFVEALTAGGPGAGWRAATADGQKLYSWSSPQTPALLAPTLTLTRGHLLLGLNPADVQASARREKSPGANFTASEAFKTAVAGVSAANLNFAYLDTRTLFERAYGTLKPLAFFGAAFLSAKGFDAVDLNKLPETEVISRHLSPMILSSKDDSQGVLLESVGPLTFLQAGVGLGGLGAGAAVYAQQVKSP